MKRNIVFLAFFFCIIGIGAQEIAVEQEAVRKKEINNIKLTERAMYAEVVELASDDEGAISLAQQKTINKLQNNVIEACARKMNMSKEGVKEIFDIIDDKCQNVVIRKGDMVRVFAYIAKDAVGLGRRKPKQKDLDEIFGPEEEMESDSIAIQKAIDDAVVQVMGKSDSINYSSVNVEQVQKVDKVVQQASQTAQQVVNQTVSQPIQTPQTVVVVQQPAQPVTNNGAQPAQTIVVVQQPAATSTTVVTSQAPSQSVAKSQPVVESQPESEEQASPEVILPVLCQKMIEKGNMDNLMVFLKQEKDYHHLMFGNSKAMQYPERCYIVILDKSTKNIVSVLDKGESERMNFMTKRMDKFSNYRNGNYAAIFVQEY